MSLSIMILIDNDIQFKSIFQNFLSDLIFLVFSLFFNLVKNTRKNTQFQTTYLLFFISNLSKMVKQKRYTLIGIPLSNIKFT